MVHKSQSKNDSPHKKVTILIVLATGFILSVTPVYAITIPCPKRIFSPKIYLLRCLMRKFSLFKKNAY